HPFTFTTSKLSAEQVKPYALVYRLKDQASPAQEPVLLGEVFQDVLHQHEAQVRACYSATHQDRPRRAGSVSVKLSIASTGRVSEARVSSSTLKDARVEACLIRHILTWQLPEHQYNTISLTYPFE